MISLTSNFPHLTSQMVGLSGLEPLTSRLSGVRSNQLSYRPMFIKRGIPSKLNNVRKQYSQRISCVYCYFARCFDLEMSEASYGLMSP